MSATDISVGDCLLPALEALRRGEDPLLQGLEQVHALLSVRRALWIPKRHSRSPRFGLVDDQPARWTSELPNSSLAPWMHEPLGPGVRVLGTRELLRDPAWEAEGIEWALQVCARPEAGRLWLDASSPRDLNDSMALKLAAMLEHLHELSLRQLDEQRIERLAEMGERAAGVAHDLRNQLSLVQLEYQRQRLQLGDSSQSLDRGLEDALGLCREFLDGAARPSSLAQIQPLLVDEIRSASTLSNRAGDVRVALNCPKDLQARYDETLLRRVVRNLLLNAIEATPSGGGVKLKATVEDSRVSITIADEGCGMSRYELDQLLRAGESKGGTGFGTTSVLSCVQRLAADLDVESEPAAGTSFTLCLEGA